MTLRRTSSIAKSFFNTTKHPNEPTFFLRDFITSPVSSRTGFFRRFLQFRAINQSASRLPQYLYAPVGDKLRQTLASFNPNHSADHSPLELLPPREASVTVEDVRKIMRTWQMEKVKEKLRQIPMNSISYEDYLGVCNEASDDHALGREIAKMLDLSGNVIVLRNVVFLRPDQVAKSVETLIHEAIGKPNDPRRKELEEMEMKKAMIDEKAESMVKAELYCGLGFLALQTLGFMRLTFWELSWDVMEPICFFTASLHFGLAYVFFLRTSKEPSFEGYFQRRFKVKQRKLMEHNKFDMEKYNQLRRAFYSMG